MNLNSSFTGWTGKTAFVTGATAGIGKVLVEQLIANKIRVVGCGRREERLQQMEKELGPDHFIEIPCDLTQGEAAIQSLFESIEKKVGPIDILINNAGIGSFSLILGEESHYSDWQKVLQLNVLAAAECMHQAFQNMKKHNVEGGQIINMSSVSGHAVPSGYTGIAMYSASKHALRALTEGVRQELRAQKSSCRICEISPGLVKTEFFDDMNREDIYDDKPFIKAEDVASTVLYILSTPAHMEVNDILLRPTGQIA